MPRTKSSNVSRRASPSGKKAEGKKKDASDVESERSGSPKPEEPPVRQGPVNRDANMGGRRFRMKLLPAVRGNPHRYKDYSPEPEGGSARGGEPAAGGSARGGEPVAGGSGLGKASRVSAASKRFAGHAKVRKFKKMRAQRPKKRGLASNKEKRASSSEISSVDSALVSSGGNSADSSSSEPEQPKRAKRGKK